MNETIAAIATGMGNAGVGIIRISGPDCYVITSAVFRNLHNKKVDVSTYQSHTAHYGSVVKSDDTFIDNILLLVMKGPNSYTGEDTAELQCHGGTFHLQQILQTVLDAGCRLAEPGEFTKRAFLNGRMDLSQAEAVMDLIEAQNGFAHRNARRQLQGDLGSKIRPMREQILYHTAYIESALDDPENYSLDGFGDKLKETVDKVLTDVEKLLETADNGRIQKTGIRTVIVGKPNAGKSTLLNALLGEERAIVTQIPGTTRDTLEESCRFGDLQLILVDTAGIHETDNEVESLGIDLTKKQIKDCDLALFLMEAGRPVDAEEKEILELLTDRKAIVILNKADRQEKAEDGEKALKADREVYDGILAKGWPIITISAKEKTGVARIPILIKDMFQKGEIDWNEEVVITSARHREALVSARKSLHNVLQSIQNQMPEDFYTIDLMDAYDELGMITGETAGEDLVNEIFSKFCTGK